MADVDTDLVGIIVASVVCFLLICVLLVFGAVFCHRRLESKRRKKAMNSNSNLIDPALLGNDPNTGLESAETLSGYRPKILNSNEEGIPEADYQELIDTPNGQAKSNQNKGKEENKKGSSENFIIQQETTQYVNSNRNTQNDKGIVVTAVEPYPVEEPSASQSKVLDGNSSVQEQNFEVHSISHEEKPKAFERQAQGQVQVSRLSEHGKDNANREEQTIVHIIPFDEVELPLVGTTRAESQIISSSSRTVSSKPVVDTVSSQSRTIHYKTTTHDDQNEPIIKKLASQSSETFTTSSGADNNSDPKIHVDQPHAEATGIVSYKYDRETIVPAVQSLSRTTHFISSSQDEDREPNVQAAQSKTHAIHNITSSAPDPQVDPSIQLQTRTNQYTFSDQDIDGETISTSYTKHLVSIQDAKIESIDHTMPSQNLSSHFATQSQDHEIKPFAETVKSQTLTTHYILSSNQDDGEKSRVQNAESQSRTTHFISSSEDSERDMIVPTAQSQTRTTHYVISSTEDDGREPTDQNTQSQSRSTRFISSSLNTDRDPIVSTVQSQTSTGHIISSQDVDRDLVVQSSKYQTTNYDLSPAYDFHTEATVPISYSQLHTSRLIEEQAKADASRNIVIISSQTGPEGRRLSSMKMPDMTTEVETERRNDDSGGIVRTYTTRNNDGSIRTYTTRTNNQTFVDGAYVPFEGERQTWSTRTYEEKPDVTSKTESVTQTGDIMRTYTTTRSNDGSVRTYTTRNSHAFVNGANIPSEGERDTWSTRTYEEKTNTVDFEGDNDTSSDSSSSSSHGDTSSESGSTKGRASRLVKDYSFTEGSLDKSSNHKRHGNADEYTILDYVDPNPSSSKSDSKFKSGMIKIGDVSGSREYKKRKDIDISAEKVPPVFTSTPRAPPEMTSYVQSYSYRQRKEYDGSVQYLPDKDLVTPL